MCAGRPGLQHSRETHHQLIEFDPTGRSAAEGIAGSPMSGGEYATFEELNMHKFYMEGQLGNFGGPRASGALCSGLPE